MRTRHPRLRGLLCATLLAAALPAAADAATLATDLRCYAQGAPLRLAADGLAPRAPLRVSLDGDVLRTRDGSIPRADETGSYASSFATPALAPGVKQLRHALAVEDDAGARATTRFTVTRPAGAAFAPERGDPRTLRARFELWGFALADGVNRRAWLHWVGPDGSVRATSALGVTKGDCGRLLSAPRRVFPFDPEPGRWLLVIDTHRRYRVQAEGPRAKMPVHVRSLPPRS